MQTVACGLDGLDQWRLISGDARYSELAPLPRLITAVRDQAQTAEELLELAFALCEVNLEIGRQEYSLWQGLSVVDATGVFSLQGLGGVLCGKHGYDFWDFLRALADLARRSQDPAQYHQCINHNLFTSPVDDQLVLDRLQSLLPSGEMRYLGCMPDTGKLLSSLVPSEPLPDQESPPAAELSSFTITPRGTPAAFRGYGRSLKLNMEGQVIVKGPFCCNVWLEQPLYWLAGVSLVSPADSATWFGLEDWLSTSQLILHYGIQLAELYDSVSVRLVLATTAQIMPEPGRAERHFWIYDSPLPLDASEGVIIPMDASHWRPLMGQPQEAYGLKCTPAQYDCINHLPIQLVLALDVPLHSLIPMGQVSLPSIQITPLRKATV